MSTCFADALSRRAFVMGSTAGLAVAAFGVGAGAGRAGAQAVPAAINLIPPAATFRWIDSGDRKAVFYKKFLAEYAADRGIEIVYHALPWNEIAQLVPLGVRNNSAHDVFALPQNVNPADAVAQGWVAAL